jgi:hypothetical protein
VTELSVTADIALAVLVACVAGFFGLAAIARAAR